MKKFLEVLDEELPKVEEIDAIEERIRTFDIPKTNEGDCLEARVHNNSRKIARIIVENP